jgi:hypothetical protein
MTDTVWVSGAITDVALLKPFASNVEEEDVDRAIEASRRCDAGEPLSAEWFPQAIWGTQTARRFKRLPQLFRGGGYCIVSSRRANVLRRFDLGQGALYSVAVLQKDRRTPVGGEWFSLCFGNVKQAFAAAASPKARPFGVAGLRWHLPFVPQDDDMAVSPAALEGPDLWIDPTLIRAFFVSGRLSDALAKADLHGPLRLHRCRVVQAGEQATP